MLKIASVFVGDVFKSNQGCLVEVVHYKKAKESYVKEVALFWQGRIEDKVFEKLMKWTVV